MHLLSAQAGAIQQDGEAIDLAQTPGAIIFASAADSELAMLAGAADRAGEVELRLANSLRLAHNLSVDLWLDTTIRHAKLVVVRLLGGASYWQYGVDELTAVCANARIPLALLPGDANPDPILRDRSTLHPNDWTALHALFTAGGPDNADALLQAFNRLKVSAPQPLDAQLTPRSPAPFARFGLWHPALGITDEAGLRTHRGGEGPTNIPILFYRAALEGAGTATLEALIAALEAQNLAPIPILVSSLKEAACVRFVQNCFAAFPPSAILNLTGFALGLDGLDAKSNPFSGTDAPVIQLLQGGRPHGAWAADPQGLTAKDLAMQVVLPELDGRIGAILIGHKQDAVWHARTQCPLSSYAPDPSGIARAVALAANWSRLRTTPRGDRHIAIVLANYPIRDGRLANGVGYDAPQSTIEILKTLDRAGYTLAPSFSPHPSGEISGAQLLGEGVYPTTSAELIDALQSGPTNAHPQRGASPAQLPLSRYASLFATLPATIQSQVTSRWGSPDTDPFVRFGAFHLPVLRFGNVAILLQPARGYDRDATANYHDPDLVPPHAYLAAYLWLRHDFGADALIHNGKHGNLEWLPGKAVGLDQASYPDALWGQVPHLYPFIVNDPGEGTQAKRRTGAVIIDHLVPPLTRAETYGPLKDLEALLDEYYAASGMDRRRLADLKRRILDFAKDVRLDRDIVLPDDSEAALGVIDNFLCDLKEAQIRDGLHVFGQSPTGDLERDLIVALARVPRGDNGGNEASLIRALADDLKLGFDPLTAKLGDAWIGPKITSKKSSMLADWRTIGDAVEALEHCAAELVSGVPPEPDWTATRAVLDTVQTIIRPRLAASGPNEINALLDGLDGKFIAPGPSGAPSRGRLDVLPTGRNFYSLDNRAVPTPTAWDLGRKSAENVILRYFQDNGNYLKSLALSVWGTANMRTGGDDIAQALAFIGAKPQWEPSSLRVSGYEIIPLAKLDRPRVDVTLRISGFFRDAFPTQITLFDRAIRAIGALDEPEDQNPIAARMRADALGEMAAGKPEAEAALSAGHRIFGSKPGAYGAGLQGLMDSNAWETKANLADAFLNWGQYAYGAQAGGIPARARFAARLSSIDAVVHNQDNREHDLLDSDDYYQFEGGLVATAETLSGATPAAYHNDHSRPDRPLTRSLAEEIAKVMRSRVVNPKWINGLRRHGYKGAFEIIATVDYMFAFAATTGAVKSHHFDLAFEAFVEDQSVRDFIKQNNRFGHNELLEKFKDAIVRGLWTPRSNSAYALLEETAP